MNTFSPTLTDSLLTVITKPSRTDSTIAIIDGNGGRYSRSFWYQSLELLPDIGSSQNIPHLFVFPKATKKGDARKHCPSVPDFT